jgi:hypothetical protein
VYSMLSISERFDRTPDGCRADRAGSLSTSVWFVLRPPDVILMRKMRMRTVFVEASTYIGFSVDYTPAAVELLA